MNINWNFKMGWGNEYFLKQHQGRNQTVTIDEARTCWGIVGACPPEKFEI